MLSSGFTGSLRESEVRFWWIVEVYLHTGKRPLGQFVMLSKPSSNRRVLYAGAIHSMSKSEEGRESSLMAYGRFRPGPGVRC